MTTGFNKAKAEPDVIDNREVCMADVLNINLPRLGFLDISSGYFEVSGYAMVRHTLEAATAKPSFSFRLMVGRDALRPPSFDTFEEYITHAGEHSETLTSGLDGADLSDSGMENVAGLIRLLERGNVHVRRGNARFNHAKCYILGDEGVIVGSSNFTGAGLSGNDELNTGVYTTSTWEKVRAWYERMWSGAQDAKTDMLQVLEQSKFGIPATPYDIYLKMLFEKYKRILTAMTSSDPATAKTLAKFQQHAVYTILQTIAERGGAMLADSTGLGKTHIGLEVMRKKIAEGKKVLLIAPAQVRDTVWRGKLEEAQIGARPLGIEELGRKDFDVRKYRRYDFIVIDESQNFRSKTATRRQNLMKMMSMGRRKQVLLMSATPVNNSLMDLYYQTSIITRGRDDAFADIGIPDLYNYMKKAANHRLSEGLEKIQLLLEAIMVRRTRTFIREMYPDENIAGRSITFPKRDYKPIRYGMTDIFGDIYKVLHDTIDSLHMVPYGIDKYNLTLTDEERKKHKVLAHLQTILLLKRFESSVKAISVSIDNKITLFKYFADLLKKGKIVSPRHLNKIMLRWNALDMDGDGDSDETRDEFFMNEIKNLPKRNAADYDLKTMKKHIQSDLTHLGQYRKILAKMPKFDKKAEAVADTILQDGALDAGGKKVLVFTEYTATAAYVKEFLKDKFGDKRVDLITGSINKSKRADIIRRFSPKANLGEDEDMPDEEIDILVSTEVLSEGQNLQDCNYVINYDLPWNPMRIVQRIGRVDRLTSIHDTIHSRECFPDENLDELLELVGKLMAKINDINESVGLDADLLGQEASPKTFKGETVARIHAMAGNDGDRVAEEMERESDLSSMMSPLHEISQYVRRAGIMKMEEFPMGRRSGKAGEGRRAVLAYLREKSRRLHFVAYDYGLGRAEIVDDMTALKLSGCREREVTHLPMDEDGHAESFRQLLGLDRLAREAISAQNDADQKMAQDLRSRPKRNEKIIEKIRNVIETEVEEGRLPIDEGEAVDAMLDSTDLLQWGDELESYLEEYYSGGSIKILVEQLRRLCDSVGIDADQDPEPETPGKLTLVGAVFIGDIPAAAGP